MFSLLKFALKFIVLFPFYETTQKILFKVLLFIINVEVTIDERLIFNSHDEFDETLQWSK